MLTIRLQRHGKKGQPAYRLVVAPARSKLIAPPTEDLGSYNPFTKQLNIKKERMEHWLKVGAQPSLTIHNLLVKAGVVTAPKKRIPMPKAVAKAEPVAEVKEEKAEEAAPQAAAEPVTEEAPAEEGPAATEAAAE